MQFRRLGNSGLVVSVVGLGTNNFGTKLDAEGCREVLDAALDAGITLIDTADSYGASEERLGDLLHGRRDDVVIATKFGSSVRRRGGDKRRGLGRPGFAPLRPPGRRVVAARSAHRLDRPVPVAHSGSADAHRETLGALTDLVHEGKVRYLGRPTSPAGRWPTRSGWRATGASNGSVSAQNEYSLLERSVEEDLVPALEHYAIGLLPLLPAGQRPAHHGKYRRGEPAPPGSRIEQRDQAKFLTAEGLRRHRGPGAVRRRRGRTLLEVAIGGTGRASRPWPVSSRARPRPSRCAPTSEPASGSPTPLSWPVSTSSPSRAAAHQRQIRCQGWRTAEELDGAAGQGGG